MNRACSILLSAALACSAAADPARLFREGNKALAEGRYDAAVAAYQAAAEAAPDSAEIQYNLGNAQYRKGDFQAAQAAYEQAATLGGQEPLTARSLYNQGNCLVKAAEGKRADDPQAALEQCRQAAWYYRAALEHAGQFQDAAYNLEVCRALAVGIGEEIRKKQDEQQKQDEMLQFIRKKLEELIEQQTNLVVSTTESTAAATSDRQRAIETETRELAKTIEGTGLHTQIDMPDGTSTPGPLQETHGHVVSAAEAMDRAASATRFQQIRTDQQTALAELEAALGAAPQSPDQQQDKSDDESDSSDEDMDQQSSDQNADMYKEADPFGDFSEYEQIRGVPPPNKSEKDILNEELRNQERRKDEKAGSYVPVDKDW